MSDKYSDVHFGRYKQRDKLNEKVNHLHIRSSEEPNTQFDVDSKNLINSEPYITVERSISNTASFIKFKDEEETDYTGNLFDISEFGSRSTTGSLGDRMLLLGSKTGDFDTNTILMKVKQPTLINGTDVSSGKYYIPIINVS